MHVAFILNTILILTPAQLGQPTNPEKVTPTPTEKQSKEVITPLPLWDKVEEGHSIYQELTITQKPTFSIQGLPFQTQSQLSYTMISKLTINKRYEDGRLRIEQKILAAKLNQADNITRQMLTPAITLMPGTTYKITLNANREVIDFEGHGNKVQINKQQLPIGQSLQLVSLLDKDGWKELTNATFFFPDKAFFKGNKWSRKMTHNWGPLGSWSGEAHYFPAGKKQKIQRIGYFYKVKYRPPVGNLGGLAIGKANFQALQSKGYIYYDTEKRRVSAVEEYFRVRGNMAMKVLGQQSAVALEEEQSFRIRIFDKNPLKTSRTQKK